MRDEAYSRTFNCAVVDSDVLLYCEFMDGGVDMRVILMSYADKQSAESETEKEMVDAVHYSENTGSWIMEEYQKRNVKRYQLRVIKGDKMTGGFEK